MKCFPAAGVFLLIASLCAQAPQSGLQEAQQMQRSARTEEQQAAATRRFEAVRSQALQQGDVQTAFEALYGLARGYLALSEYERAIEAFENVAAYRRRTADRFGESLTLHNLAVARWLKGDAPAALTVYRDVLPIRHELKDEMGVAYTLSGIASCHWSMGETAKALEAHREALEIWVKIKNDRGQGDTLNSIGLTYVQLGDLDRANAELQKALQIWQRLANKVGEAYTLNNLGMAAIAGRKPREALDLYARALPALETAGDKRGQAYALHNMGTAYDGMGRQREATERFTQSLALKREIQDRWGEAYSLQALGEMAVAAGDRSRASELFREALEIRRAVQDRSGLITTLAVLARLERDDGIPTVARERIAEAIESIESLRSELVSEDLRSSWFATKRDYYEFYVDTLVQLGEDRKALEIAERARGRLLLDRLSATLSGVRSGADPSLIAAERKLQSQINAAADRLRRYYSGPRSPQAAPAIERELTRLSNRHKELREQIRRSSPRFAQLTEPPLLSAQEIQQLLDKDSLLLYYLAGRERSHLWVVRSASVHRHTLPAARILEAAAGSRDANSLREISRLLLSPAAEEIRRVRPKRIVIGTDGALESVPFTALALPGDAEPLIARFEIAGMPSASALALSRRSRAGRAAASKAVIAVADPVYGPPDPRLPEKIESGAAPLPRLRFSLDEARAIEGLLPESGRTIAAGFDASRQQLLRMPLDRYGILHFAAHTDLNGKQPELSGIVLSQFDPQGRALDGFLRLHEIYNLDLRARLVVLSACRSALGPNLRGEGLMGVTRGFLYAGASTVLATLWDVGDKPASELVKRFYRALLADRLPPAAALRAAQNSLRGDPLWDDVSVWGAFTLQGEWR